MVPTSKWCGKCSKTKPIEDFNKDTARRDGKQGHCRACQAVRRRAYYGDSPTLRQRNREQVRAWKAAHPEAARVHDARKRARKRGATPELFTTAELYALWADADAWACTFCGAPWEHIEHFVPLARGGAHALGNLWPACADCNLSKSDRDPWEYLRSRGVPHV